MGDESLNDMADIMSDLLYNGFQGGSPMYVDTENSCGNFDMSQYVNPQDTDKQYHRPQDSQPSTIPSGLMTPPQTVLDTSSRRPSLMLSSTSVSCNAGPGSASSTFSLSSSPGFPPSSCPSSASTTPSSRRQSTIYSQQYQLSVNSPSSLFPSGLPKEPWNIDQQSLQESFSSEDYGISSSTTSFSGVGDPVISDPEDNHLAVNAQMAWPESISAPCSMLLYEAASRTNPSACFTADLVSDFNGALASRSTKYCQPNLESPPPSIFPAAYSQDLVSLQCTATTSPSALKPSWKHRPGGYDQDMSCSEDESPSNTERLPCTRIKRRRPQKTSIRRGSSEKSDDGPNVCEYCPLLEPIGIHWYACNRPEHLKRHYAAKHPRESGVSQELYICKFPDCIDKKTGKRKIIVVRGDNFKAHYNKTHFSYGNTEKSGKNVRKSMKMSIELGLRNSDARWPLMLAGKMKVGEDVKGMADGNKPGQNFSSVWKMIGYSIKETREIKVKDIAPDWQGPDETTLEKFDCRWKALKDDSLEYEQAMSVGTNMLETPKQGLLGVDMMESKAMGLAGKDPRWKMLLSGRMSTEDAEKLGVRQLALQAKRKRSLDE